MDLQADLTEQFGEKLPQNALQDTELSDIEKNLERLVLLRLELMTTQSQKLMEALFSENTTLPIRVKNVQMTGGETFRDAFLCKQLRPLLAQELFTLTDFVRAVDASYHALQKHQVLQNCLIQIHTLPRKPWQMRSTLEIVPVFNLLPQKRFFAKTGTNVGNGEGDGYIQFLLRNLFGGGENLVFDAVTGTKTPSSYLCDYSQPMFLDPRYVWNTLLYVNTRKLDAIQSTVETTGVTNKILTRFDAPTNFNVAFENCWRSLSNHGLRSLEVMSQLATSYKSSVLLNAEYDSRDSRVLPLTGHFARLGLEHCGLFSNNIAYSKIIWESQLAQKVHQNHSLLFSTRAGALFNTRDRPSSILDRFNCGGPNDIRSFSLNGLGPKDNNSSVGGDFFASCGLSVVSKIPRVSPNSNFKLHHFINAGKLFASKHELCSAFYKNYSVGVGSGIMYNHPMARFELNFVLPLCASSTDYVRKGLQYGVGVSFL